VSGVQQIEKCSLSKAIDIVLASPEGQMAFRAQKRDEMLASGAYTEADMITHDSIEAVRKYRRDSHDVAKAGQAAWLELVDRARAKYPQMTLSEIYDLVRRENPEAWWSWKSPAPGSPASGELSGRPNQPRGNNWTDSQTGSSGSNQRGGSDVRPAAPADDTVRYKRGPVRKSGADENRAIAAMSAVLKSIVADDTLDGDAKLKYANQCIDDYNKYMAA
jgi:hypothetical protein